MKAVSGIYRIVCDADGKYYFGSSKNIDHRWRCHKSDLRKNIHDNVFVQRVWNKYGEKSFRIELMEVVSEDDLTKVEQRYLDEHIDKFDCMNIANAVVGGTRGKKLSDATRKKMRVAALRRWSDPQFRKKMKESYRQRILRQN